MKGRFGAVTRRKPKGETNARCIWRVDCQPHVRIRLKRVFTKIARTSHGVLTVSDTPENCRDLLWFLDRYPMNIDELDREYLVERAGEYLTKSKDVAKVIVGNYVPRPFELAIPPRDYQRQAAELALQKKGSGLLIGDDVGLGKTVSAICMLTQPESRPALVVTLAGAMPRQWQQKLAEFAPGLRTHILKSTTPYDLRASGCQDGQGELFSSFPDVIVTNYHKLSAWAATLAPLLKSVVYDEIQELRRDTSGSGVSLKYAAARHISEHAHYRVGLSATPFYNYGEEMYAILSCLMPDEIGTKQEFREEHLQNKMLIDPDAFGAYLRTEGMMIRRTRAEVGRELPGLTRVPHFIDIDDSELEKVEADCAALARFILTKGGKPSDKMQAGGELDMKLRRATGLAKAKYVARFVELLIEQGEKRVLLYGWHHAVYDVWREELSKLEPRFFTGEESPTQKGASLDAFLKGPSKVMVMSLRAGAGLDGLQHGCRTIVHGELDWSPGVHEQCDGRVDRDGQPEKVMAYYLMAESGSDPIIADVLGLKTSQIEGVRNPNQNMMAKLEVGGAKVQRLAEAFLRQRGQQPPAQPAEETGT